MNFNNKNVLVVGAAKSGISAARLLVGLGAVVTVSDNKPIEKIDGIDELKKLGVTLKFGENAGEDLVYAQSLVIQSPGVPLEIDTFQIARKHSIAIMGELELAFSVCPCPVVAITGTNGKTTTTALTGEIIKGFITNTITAGNIGEPFSECVSKLSKDSCAVIEASSFQLENTSIFNPKISVILNITSDHIDRHKTMEKYIEAKTNIFKYAGKESSVIINKDDNILNKVSIPKAAKVLRFSTKNAVDEGAYIKNGVITIVYDKTEISLININELQILGEHNVQNALAAVVSAFCAQVPAHIIIDGLKRFKGVAHRLEFLREFNGVKYYNDSKGTNPEASIKALMSMRGKTVLIAGGYDKKSNFDDLTRLFAQRLSHLIVMGETKEQIIESSRKMGFFDYTKAQDMEEAVNIANKQAKMGENILLSPACASWDMFRNYEERGERFKQMVLGL